MCSLNYAKQIKNASSKKKKIVAFSFSKVQKMVKKDPFRVKNTKCQNILMYKKRSNKEVSYSKEV